jgi:hypothetical protein
LIKDNELDVHYHTGKANVVADAFGRKGHCNYLPAMHSTGQESSTRVLLDLSLFNITLTPTLKDEIIATQKNDAGMATSREGYKKVTQKLFVSTRMRRVPCGSRIDWLC